MSLLSWCDSPQLCNCTQLRRSDIVWRSWTAVAQQTPAARPVSWLTDYKNFISTLIPLLLHCCVTYLPEWDILILNSFYLRPMLIPFYIFPSRQNDLPHSVVGSDGIKPPDRLFSSLKLRLSICRAPPERSAAAAASVTTLPQNR